MSEQVIGITGPNGFIAGHLVRRLTHQTGVEVLVCTREAFDDPQMLAEFVGKCDTIVHLAAVNRGTDQEIHETNTRLIDCLVAAAELAGNNPHIVFSSSSQSSRDNAYGRSKKYGEEALTAWAGEGEGRAASILVIPNVYGPGCRPFYNSVVATFCYQLAHGEEPSVIQDAEVEFIWINHLVDLFCKTIEEPPTDAVKKQIDGTAKLKISELLAKLQGYRDSQEEQGLVPDISDPFNASLYATYLSYLSLEDHCRSPQVHRDERGHLFEIIRMTNGGQVFFSTTKPGVVRGNHFHTRKIEWFCVLKGEAAIRLRRIGDTEIHEFRVSGDSPRFISIPVLYTHQIENVGTEELLTMFWCNEIFTAEDADTYMEKVA